MDAGEFEATLKQARKAIKKQDYLEAIDLFEEVLESDPDNIDVHEGLATACYLAQDLPGAIRHFTRVTQLKPRDSTAWVNLGAIFNLQGDHQQAANSLRKGIQRDGKNAEAYYNLGIAQKNLGQTSMSVSAYREAVRLNPEMVEAHVNLANIYVDQVNFRKAIQHYELALKADPSFEKARRGLERARIRSENSGVAANPFGRLVDTSRLEQKSAPAEEGPELTEDERFEDRQLIQLATAESANLATHLWKHLTEHMEPSLLHINRLLAQDTKHQRGMYEAREEFCESLRFLKEVFANWQAEYHRLKQHEDEMAAEK